MTTFLWAIVITVLVCLAALGGAVAAAWRAPEDDKPLPPAWEQW